MGSGWFEWVIEYYENCGRLRLCKDSGWVRGGREWWVEVCGTR